MPILNLRSGDWSKARMRCCRSSSWSSAWLAGTSDGCSLMAGERKGDVGEGCLQGESGQRDGSDSGGGVFVYSGPLV